MSEINLLSGAPPQQPGTYSPATLAYIGDAVFELLVRNAVAAGSSLKAGKLHKKTVSIVNAGNQAKMAEALMDFFTEAEAAVYKRGRNTAVSSMPKNANLAEYCKATGFEAVFGRLYLDGNTDRILELFRRCLSLDFVATLIKG